MEGGKTAGRISLTDPLLACVLLTRLPLPKLPARAFQRQASAAWAFPLAGLAVAVPAAFAGWAALAFGISPLIAAGLVLTVQIMVTGAMHEDGLADTADGLWGGFDRARRLEIMKDSAIGSYGVLALILSLGLRWMALAAILETGVLAILAVATLSRAVLPAMMTALPHARADGLSHSVGRPGWTTSMGALGLGLFIALLASGPAVIGPFLLAVLAVGILAVIAKRKIGGQTGDILGASQQVSEITLLIALAAT
ncbi:adenosylcobinamide-GDP ribazoletransferase [Sulfitobacter sp. BDSS02]|nr:adenosylcobinamide-GDP ribazoletransferase [Sulfitobacter sp. BDSS02]MBR9849173.1 adenosylcobinamide-GDP ribazoletransferase [Paracoccaceae bacterium]